MNNNTYYSYIKGNKNRGGGLFFEKNNDISCSTIKVIGINNTQLGLIDKLYALNFARKLKLDVVNITTNGKSHLYKILRYDKYLYLLRKKSKNSKSNTNKINKIKEIKFNINISERDLEIKINRGVFFLKKMLRVKFIVIFKKKYLNLRDKGVCILNKIYSNLNLISKKEGSLKNSSRYISMSLTPLKSSTKTRSVI